MPVSHQRGRSGVLTGVRSVCEDTGRSNFSVWDPEQRQAEREDQETQGAVTKARGLPQPAESRCSAQQRAGGPQRETAPSGWWWHLWRLPVPHPRGETCPQGRSLCAALTECHLCTGPGPQPQVSPEASPTNPQWRQNKTPCW